VFAEGLLPVEGHGAVVVDGAVAAVRSIVLGPPGSAVPRGGNARSQGFARAEEVVAGEVVLLEKVIAGLACSWCW
jgi:hypothetical protein